MVGYDPRLQEWLDRLKDLSLAERQRELDALRGRDPEFASRVEAAKRDAEISTESLRKMMARSSVGPDPPQRVADFVLLGSLDRGGQGLVFRARQDGTNRTVAVKLFPPSQDAPHGESHARFEREAQILGQLEHPNIARVISAGIAQVDGWHWPYIAMELVRDALDVVSYAKRNGLSLDRSVALIGVICDAVEVAHQRGVFHRDLKPGNILVDGDGNVRIIDFGIAARADEDLRRTRLTQTDAILGTAMYMSPEQARSEKWVDARSDVYSLGAVAYEILCEQVPVRASPLESRSVEQVIEWTDPEPPRSKNPRIPRAVSDVIETALRKDPRDRYESAGTLGKRLREALAGGTDDVRPLSRIHRYGRWCVSHPVLSMLAGLVLVSASVAVAMVLRARISGLETLAQGRLATARSLISYGDWQDAKAAIDAAAALDRIDPAEIDLALIDILEGQSQIGSARSIIAALEARASELTPGQRAHVLLLSGDHSREPSLVADPNLGREKVVAALESGALSGSEAAYARAILSPSPIEQGDQLLLAIQLDPGNRRAFEMLVPTLLFSGRAREARVEAFRFRGRFPKDPCSGFAELAVRCIVDGEKLAVLRDQYPEIPEDALRELEGLLHFRESFGAFFRGLVKAGMVNDRDPVRSKQIVASVQALAFEELFNLSLASKSKAAESLYRLPPALAVFWGKIAKTAVLGVLTKVGASTSAKALDEHMPSNREAGLRLIRGILATKMGNDLDAAKYFLEAAELAPDSLFLVEPASSLIGLSVAARVKDRSELARLEATLRHVLARNDLEGDEFWLLADIASEFLNKGSLAREIVFRWISTRPTDPDGYVKTVWVERSEGNNASAMRYTRLALSIDPNHIRALQLLTEFEKLEYVNRR